MTKKRPQPVIHWTDCNIPARLFFDIMYSGEYSKLGTDTPEKLETAFDAIFDEYYVLLPNRELKEWLAKHERLNKLQSEYNGILVTIQSIEDLPLNAEQLSELITLLNSYKSVQPKFNTKKPVTEIKRIHNQVLGVLRNKMNEAAQNVKYKSEKIKYNFYKDKANLRMALEGLDIHDDISLYEWAEYVKIAQQKQKPNGK